MLHVTHLLHIFYLTKSWTPDILKDLNGVFFQAMENVTKMLKLMMKNGLLTDDPATSELSSDMDTDENRTDLNKNIL